MYAGHPGLLMSLDEWYRELTRWGWVMQVYTSVNWTTMGSDSAYSTLSHYLNQLWLLLTWARKQISVIFVTIFIQDNQPENKCRLQDVSHFASVYICFVVSRHEHMTWRSEKNLEPIYQEIHSNIKTVVPRLSMKISRVTILPLQSNPYLGCWQDIFN